MPLINLAGTSVSPAEAWAQITFDAPAEKGVFEIVLRWVVVVLRRAFCRRRC